MNRLMVRIVRHSIILACLLCVFCVRAQVTKRALFLGNSYTQVNNLPQLVANVAASTGNTLIYDMNAPGGYYLAQHLTNSTSLAKIAAGNWNYVVLQDQSMALAYPSTYRNMLLYSLRLDSTIKAQNLCAQTVFYGTWGRKNGDTYLCTPPECPVDTWITRTYYQMDSTIGSHYHVFADSAKAAMSPVGAVWRYIRQNHPSIELFDPDESHPSLAGSYAAACSFYAVLFRMNPALVTYNPGILPTEASAIRQAAKLIVYDQLPAWNIGIYDSLLNSSCLPLGVNETTANTAWRVYPNPVKNLLHIELPANAPKDKVSLYNALGLLIKEAEVQGTDVMSVDELPAGLYLVKAQNSGRSWKILKE